MGRKNQRQALQSGPPPELAISQKIGKVETINGNNIYTVILPDLEDESISGTARSLHLVELPPKFRNTMWIRRGGFVLIDCGAFEGRENKLSGEIVTVIHDEKSWRKMDYWPNEFKKAEVPTPMADPDTDDSLSGGNPNRRPYDSDHDEED